jgi:hypothetical protein
MTVAPAARPTESMLVGAAGGALGGLSWWWIHPVVGGVFAASAALSGVISGWRGIYDWRRPRGWLGFVLDSTWALLPVSLALVAHVVALVRRGGYVPAMSHRRGYHVYRAGLALKPGYALTLGNVISGAGDVERVRRAKLITDHEAVHVWQARWFGPFYLVIYGLWSGLAALVGLVMWWRRGRTQPRGAVIEAYSYYMNPFEWWAYSRDGFWPPSGLPEGMGWKGPVVRSFAELRDRHSRDDLH